MKKRIVALLLTLAMVAAYMPMLAVTSFAGKECKHDNSVSVPGQAATCTADGWKDYFECSVCHHIFSNAEGADECDNLDAWKSGAGKIPAEGHKFAKIINPVDEEGNIIKDSLLAQCECGNDMAAIAVLAADHDYDGKPADVSIHDGTEFHEDLEGTWMDITGLEPTLTYFKGEQMLDEAPTEVGKYTVEISVEFEEETYTASADYSILEVEKPKEDDKGVKTGDTDNMLLYFLLGLGAACGAGFVYKRREN